MHKELKLKKKKLELQVSFSITSQEKHIPSHMKGLIWRHNRNLKEKFQA